MQVLDHFKNVAGAFFKVVNLIHQFEDDLNTAPTFSRFLNVDLSQMLNVETVPLIKDPDN